MEMKGMLPDTSGTASAENFFMENNYMEKPWKMYFSKLKSKPAELPFILTTWEPDAPGNIRFLKGLTQEMSLKWWRKTGAKTKMSIITELIRIDDGRGIILPWLVSVMKEKPDGDVLQVISMWKPRHGCFPLLWLEGWQHNVQYASTGDIRKLAWKTMASGWKMMVDHAAETNQEPGEGKLWQERMACLLTEWLPKESSGDVLALMAGCRMSRLVPGKERWGEVFRQWEKKLDALRTEREKYSPQTAGYRKIIWEGMIASAAAETEFSARMTTWLERCLPEEWSPEVLEVMATWNGLEKMLPGSLLEMWCRKLITALDREQEEGSLCNFTRMHKVRKVIWNLVKQQFPWNDPSSLLPWDIWELCREALEREQSDRVLKEIMLPGGTTPEQRRTWNGIWYDKFQNSSPCVKIAAGFYLLRLNNQELLPSGMDMRSAKSLVLKYLEDNLFPRESPGTEEFRTEDHLIRKAMTYLTKSLEKNQFGTTEDWEVFVAGWQRLWNSGVWEQKYVYVKVDAVTRVEEKIRELCRDRIGYEQGGEALTGLWEEMIKNETGTDILSVMISAMRKPVWNSDSRLNRVKERIIHFWRNRLRDGDERIREKAWQMVLLSGDAAGDDIVQFLTVEKSPDILKIMAGWEPSGEKALPSGFWGRWKDTLLDRAMENVLWGAGVETGIDILYCLSDSFRTWIPQNEQEYGEVVDFWNAMDALHLSFPTRKLEYLLRFQRNFLETVMPDKFHPDVFHEKLKGVFRHNVVILAERLEKMRALTDERQAGIPSLPSVRHQAITRGLAIAASFRLGHYYSEPRGEGIFRENCTMLRELWNNSPWLSNESPPEWNYLHQFLMSDQKGRGNAQFSGNNGAGRGVSEIMRLGHALHLPSHKRAFLHTMEKIWNCPGHRYANIMETALWREIAVFLTLPGDASPDIESLESDSTPCQVRLFRQMVHSFFVKPSRSGFLADSGQPDKNERSFWTEAGRQLFPQFCPGAGFHSLNPAFPFPAGEMEPKYSFRPLPGKDSNQWLNSSLRNNHRPSPIAT